MKILAKMTSFKADGIDVLLIKIGVFAATLLFAKLWPTALSFAWYWYFIVWMVVAIRPVIGYFKWFRLAVAD